MAGGDDIGRELGELAGDARSADAAAARSRERHLRDAATADASILGILLDLAERRSYVALRTSGGRTVTGRIVVVARDALVVETPARVLCYVAAGAIVLVRRLPGSEERDPSGDRPPPRDTTFAALVAGLAPERPRVAVVGAGDDTPIKGELRAGGNDVLTVRADGEPPTTVYLATAQVSELTVLASG